MEEAALRGAEFTENAEAPTKITSRAAINFCIFIFVFNELNFTKRL